MPRGRVVGTPTTSVTSRFTGGFENIPEIPPATDPATVAEYVWRASDSGSLTIVDPDYVSAIANLGTAGSAPLSQATPSAQPRLAATPARLEFDGTDDVVSGATSIAAGPATIYVACIVRPVVAQNDNTLRGVLSLTPDNNVSRIIMTLGSGAGATDRASFVFISSGTARVYRYRGGNLAADTPILMEMLWAGTTYSATLNGANAALDAAGTPTSANLRANPKVYLGSSYTGGPISYGNADHLEHAIATSDISATVRAWAAQEYGEYGLVIAE